MVQPSELSLVSIQEEIRRGSISAANIDYISSASTDVFVDRARELGRTLSSADLAAFIPPMVERGAKRDLCNRTLFALELMLGAGEPQETLIAPGGVSTLLEYSERVVSQTGGQYADRTLHPIDPRQTIDREEIPVGDDPVRERWVSIH